MAKLMLYRVLREHQGEKPYVTGDDRIADPDAVSHLVPNVLEEVGPAPEEPAPDDANAEKAEGASTETKSEGASPSNKAETAAPARKAKAKAPARKR
jgi:hypothetical protein